VTNTVTTAPNQPVIGGLVKLCSLSILWECLLATVTLWWSRLCVCALVGHNAWSAVCIRCYSSNSCAHCCAVHSGKSSRVRKVAVSSAFDNPTTIAMQRWWSRWHGYLDFFFRYICSLDIILFVRILFCVCFRFLKKFPTRYYFHLNCFRWCNMFHVVLMLSL